MQKFPITSEGYKKMEEEIRYLKYELRPEIANLISTAREHGDLSENAEYHAAREKQSFNEGRIIDLEDKYSRSEVIDYTKFSNDTIKFGAIVKLIDDATEKEYSYRIFSEYEADLSKNIISVKSPLAKGLIGKSVGDIVEINTPKGLKIYEIIEISYSEEV
ncbi:MAG TPA: transcription elongation factor GreA [Candidatus Megaira endosymbiont of Hartmannula sinica]|nr:transcription elongation factor GreA [Candidatus Megaera endosymbiont of Hartmannula sinica]